MTVLDRDGKPVPGLTADDFEVKLDGHVQPVRALTYEQIAAPADTPALGTTQTAQTRTTTNAPPAGAPRVFVILVDDLSMTPFRGKLMFFAADRFVAGLPASDLVGFTTSSRASSVNPTVDHAAIQATLRHTVGEFIDDRDFPPKVDVGIQEALDIDAGDASLLNEVIARDCFGGQFPTPQMLARSECPDVVGQKQRLLAGLAKNRARRQIQAYVDVINAMRASPGLKHLVLLSDGLGVPAHDAVSMLAPVVRAAAAAEVQLSVLVEEPDDIDMSDSVGKSLVRRDDNRALMSNLETVADMTGGNFYRVIGMPDRFFGRVALASSAMYHLGLQAPAGSAPGREFTLAARVHRPSLTVHANRQALAPAPIVVVPVEDQLRTSVAAGVPHYEVPISVATALRRADVGGQLDLGVNVEVPATVTGPLTTMFGLMDDAGTLRTGRKVVAAAGDGGNYRISLSLPVAPGRYHLRFAVADAGDHVGSIDFVVTAQLGHVGPFTASDLLTAWTDADGNAQFLALEAVPSAATGLRAFLELYPASNVPVPADTRVRLTLLASGQAAPLEDHDVVPNGANGALRANAQFALDRLVPGTYEIRATVFVAGAAVGTVSTTVRKQ